MKPLLLILFLIAAIPIAAQTISGIVYEKDESGNLNPLSNANIYLLEENRGTASQVDGSFSIELNSDEPVKLIVSYIGYQPDTLSVAPSDEKLEIILSINRELQEIVVSDFSYTKYFDNLAPQQTEVLTSKELLKAACCNLAESFTTNASIDVQYEDAVIGSRQIQLLGLAGSYTQFMYENIPTLNGLGSSFGLEYFPGPWMTAISISKGAASVVNGMESISGQINLDLKKPDDFERYYLNVFQSSHLKTDINANAAFQLNENLSSIVLAHSNFNLHSRDNNGDSFSDHPNVRQINFLNRWNYQSFKGYESQLGVHVINENRKGGQIHSHHNSGIHKGHDYQIDFNTERYEAFWKQGFVFSGEPYTSLGIMLNGLYHDQNGAFGVNHFNAKERKFYSNLLFETRSSDESHSLVSGGSFIAHRLEENYLNFSLGRTEYRPGLFAEYSYSPSYDFSVTPGFRADFSSIYGTILTPRIHFRYLLDDNTTLRLSAGKGSKPVNLFADNIHLLASSRRFILIDEPLFDEAWNYGINLTRYFTINDRDLRLTADFYRTDFTKQSVIDIDANPQQVRIYDLDGRSYSNNLQIEADYELFSRLSLLAAFKYSDVKTEYQIGIQEKPLHNKIKALFTFSYFTQDADWKFDGSFLYNGGGRIPSTEKNPIQYRREQLFPSWVNINAQVTKTLGILDIYIGGENLLNFRQENPVIAADDPFGRYFDSSLIWGPVDGIKFYAGFRLSVL